MDSKSSHGVTRPLEGWVVGISVSKSDNLTELGYELDDVNRVTVRLSEALLIAGARLVFGHDWRPDGVMDAICRIAVRFQTTSKNCATEPLIRNLVTWPETPSLESELRDELEKRGVLKIETIRIPDNSWTSVTKNYVIARGIALTDLRRRLATITHARVCLGGAEKRTEGFHAGVLEEAYNAAIKGCPVYVGEFLGGASESLIAALRHPDIKQPSLEVGDRRKEEFDKVFNSPFRELLPERDLTDGFNMHAMQAASGLDADDWQRLLIAPDVESFSALVIRGLSKLPKPTELPHDSESKPNTESQELLNPVQGQTTENVVQAQAAPVKKKAPRKPPK